MDVDSFARRLKVRRRAAGLTQRQLAERAGVKQPLIAALESGRRAPSPAVRQALDETLRVRPSALLRLLSDDVLATATAAGARNVRVFGSIARGQDQPDSDIDLLVSLPPGADIVTLLDLEVDLSRILTVRVDLVSDGGRPHVLAKALAEAVPL